MSSTWQSQWSVSFSDGWATTPCEIPAPKVTDLPRPQTPPRASGARGGLHIQGLLTAAASDSSSSTREMSWQIKALHHNRTSSPAQRIYSSRCRPFSAWPESGTTPGTATAHSSYQRNQEGPRRPVTRPPGRWSTLASQRSARCSSTFWPSSPAAL